ncbi:hypothetical protein PPMP20_19070 [Paraburkholderia phymatum]|nr:hypothetical protein [Paraburkholderia phymatum]
MNATDLLVELLNLDAEIKHARQFLAAPKSMRPWRDKADVQRELAWLEQRREQIAQALASVPQAVRPTPHTRSAGDFRVLSSDDCAPGEPCDPAHENVVFLHGYNFFSGLHKTAPKYEPTH